MAWLQNIIFTAAEAGSLGIFAAAAGYFGLLYFGFAGVTWLLTQVVLQELGFGEPLDPRPLRENQIAKEIRRSVVSILVFGLYGIVMRWAYLAGLIGVEWEARWTTVVWQIPVLFAWNELHFYLCHRVLHTRWLYRHVHRIHHESVIPTPWSMYSFHWLEAAMLGSVMFLALLAYPFSLGALFSLPLLSILWNAIGHSNYSLTAASRAHSLHHRRVGGNYGFSMSLTDKAARTQLRP